MNKLVECVPNFSEGRDIDKIDSIENELLLFRARLNFRCKENQNAKNLINRISPIWIKKNRNIQKTIFLNSKRK